VGDQRPVLALEAGSMLLDKVVKIVVKVQCSSTAHLLNVQKRRKIMDGVTIALIVVALLIIPSSNKALNEKCKAEVEQGIAESVQECRRYYIKEKG
jgi:hypothetical protein